MLKPAVPDVGPALSAAQLGAQGVLRCPDRLSGGAQVHLAQINGEKVVVKVQRPGLKSLFDIDLKNVRRLLQRPSPPFLCPSPARALAIRYKDITAHSSLSL